MSNRLAVRALVLVLFAIAALAACGDDDTSSETLGGEADGPVISIDVDDTGWSVATAGYIPATGDVPVRLTNSRTADAELSVFLAPDDYEAGDPVPAGVDPVLERTLAAGADEQVTITFDEAGDYSILVDPLTTGDAQRIGQGFTIGEG